jgi:hypothetical protein
LHLHAHLGHQPRHALVVDRPAGALELCGDAPVAIGRPAPGHCLNRRPQRAVVPPRDRLIVVAARRHVQHVADHPHRIRLRPRAAAISRRSLLEDARGFFCHLQLQRLLAQRPLQLGDPRLGLAVRPLDFSNTLAAFSTNCRRQRAMISGLTRCSRDASATLLPPLNNSSTTCALNAAVNCRRLAIVNPPLEHHIRLTYLSKF